eukprot:Selendium_serpulae@DN4347_c0_g1_i1.p1
MIQCCETAAALHTQSDREAKLLFTMWASATAAVPVILLWATALCLVVWLHTFMVVPQGRALLYELPQISSSRGDLYIWGETYREGMANAMKRVSELLMIAKALNATYVEPCVSNGYLLSCQLPQEREKPIPTRNRLSKRKVTLRLGEIFDIERLKAYHPLIISHNEFYERTKDNTTWYKFCPRQIRIFDQTCHSQSAIVVVQAAVEASNKGQRAVAQFTSLFMDAWYRTDLNKTFYLVDLPGFRSRYFYFKQEHHDFVEKVLNIAGLGSNNFSLVHWRSERADEDYLTCARAVADAKDLMQANFTTLKEKNEPFFVATSVTKSHNLAWNAGKNKTTGPEIDAAVDFLLDEHHFLRFELLMIQQGREYRDKFFAAVYDLILAGKANKFATCVPGCVSKFCIRCNYRLSNFSPLAVSFRRRDYHKQSLPCWPENGQDL